MSKTTDAPQADNADTDTVQMVRQYLEANAAGRDNAVTTGEVAADLDIDEDHDTNPATRRAVKALREDGEIPIYGFSDGYCVLASDEDLEAAIERIRSDVAALNRLKQNLEANYAAYQDDAEESPDGPECAKCGQPITGDPLLWFSVELCRECYDERPPTEDAFREWVEA